MRLGVETVVGFGMMLGAAVGVGAVGGWSLVKFIEWLSGGQ